MKNSIFIFLIFLVEIGLSQNSYITQFESNNSLFGSNIIQLNDSSFIIGGSSNTNDFTRPLLIKFNNLGIEEDRYSNIKEDSAWFILDLLKVNDTSFLSLEAVIPNNSSKNQYFLINKYNEDLSVLETIKYTPKDSLLLSYSFLRYNNGNYIIFGSYTSFNRFIILINKDTTILHKHCCIKDLHISDSNYFYFTKTVNRKLFLYKANIFNMDTVNIAQYNNYTYDSFRQFFTIWNKNLYFFSTGINPEFERKIILYKTDSLGNIIKNKIFNSDFGRLTTIFEGMSNVQNSYFYTLNNENSWLWIELCKFDSNLNLIFKKFIETKKTSSIDNVVSTNDGGCIVLTSTIFQPQKEIIIVYKFDQYGNLPTNLPSDIKISDFAVYPNPASNFINIKKGVQIEQAEFILYNLAGQMVLQTALNNDITQLDVSVLQQGVYVYNIVQNGKIVDRGKTIVE